MRGPYQEARRIPHAIRELAPSPTTRGKYIVELLPHEGEPIPLPPQPTYPAAIVAAQEWIDVNLPGHTI